MTTVKRSLDEIDTSDIDWRKVDATTEEEIARQIAGDPDTAPDMAGRLGEARVVRPPAAVDVRAIRARPGCRRRPSPGATGSTGGRCRTGSRAAADPRARRACCSPSSTASRRWSTASSARPGWNEGDG